MAKEIFTENKSEKEPELPNATLLFLIKKSQEEITDLCLAMKKRGFGVGKWNGVGGKVKENKETIEEATKRETMEEIGVNISTDDLKKVAKLSFYFPHNSEWNKLVHVYFAENWDGEPRESEEMRPEWFSSKDIPFKDMWEADIDWLKKVIEGNFVIGEIKFGENDVVLDKEINIVEKL
jgi:8-oxo-dGTP pyrophosphatase MutT (NUDIX family)